MGIVIEQDAARVHVVIVGAGFAGLHCAQRLASNGGVKVTLIDKHNYQQFATLMTSVRARIAALFELASDYFGTVRVNPSLDRPSEEWASDERARVPVGTSSFHVLHPD